MAFLKLLARHHNQLSTQTRRLSVAAAAAVLPETAIWTPAPLLTVSPAARSLFHVAIDVSDSPELAVSHTRAGQYLQLRVPRVAKPSFLAIASPPSLAAARGVFEFLVKSVPGSTAELLCDLRRGDIVELSHIMGDGFDIDRISPPEKFQTVLIFAAGSGISVPENLERMAYQDRFKNWEASGVDIVPVLSQPDDTWTGDCGFVQAAFSKAKRTFSPRSTGAVLCGRRRMTEEVTSVLLANGVPAEKILKNF
ncbi:fruit protein pKIWI502-like isoform X2 [Ipomoea triloba]|uniref:fruit protein pKIWI502-like isoform X2 n=1 Tax=Ipomoea triloba TaxID=35885 RepID=UPI00125D14EA|nr:fruit protein pKIWI502-like isoform X2 [Ipomoea triloba]